MDGTPSGAARAVGFVDRAAAVLPWIAVAVAFAFGLRRLDNTDTWWHLAAGRWIAMHHAVPRTDTLSFTVPDHPWTDLQWLFELAIYALFSLGGPTLVVVAAAVACAGAVALVVANVRAAVGPAVTAALALWATAVAQERFAIRPEIVSFVLLGAVLRVCATRSRLWLLPALMIVWVNCHSLFVLGVFVIACHVAGALLAQTPLLPAGWREPVGRDDARRMLVAGGVAILATLANPYGPAGVVFPLKLYSRISGANPVFRSIGEFRPPFSGYFVTFSVTAYQLLFVFAVAVVVVAAAVAAVAPAGARAGERSASRAERRRGGTRTPAPTRTAALPVVDAAGLAVFVGLAAMSLLARRNMALFALGATPFVARCLAALAARSAVLARTGTLAARGLAVALPPATVALVWFVATNGFYRWNSELHEFGTGTIGTLFPVRAAAFGREVGLRGPMFNDMTSGGYFAWQAPVDGGVWMDGRLEVYDTDFFAKYSAMLADPPRWQAAVDAAGVQTAVLFHWWPPHRPLAQKLVSDPRWALVYFDDTVLMLVRRAGNQDTIARATAAFAAEQPRIEEALASPVSPWQWPVARARSLQMYGAVLDLMGKGDRAAVYYTRFLDLRPPRQDEGGVDVRLAQYHANRGETDVARTYLRRAAAANPNTPGLAQLSAQIGR
jgi:hypothetical protein